MHHLTTQPYRLLASHLTILITCCFLGTTTLCAQISTRRNLDLLDSLVHSASQNIVKQLHTPLFPQDTLHVVIMSHEGSWMVENAVFANLRRAKRYRAMDSAIFHTKLTVRLNECAIRYFSCNDKFDMLERETSCALAAQTETRDGIVQPLQTVLLQIRDTVARQAIANLESKQYSFTSATIPDATPNFWKQVVEPAVVILAGVLVVALFFFVRTQ